MAVDEIMRHHARVVARCWQTKPIVARVSLAALARAYHARGRVAAAELCRDLGAVLEAGRDDAGELVEEIARAVDPPGGEGPAITPIG